MVGAGAVEAEVVGKVAGDELRPVLGFHRKPVRSEGTIAKVIVHDSRYNIFFILNLLYYVLIHLLVIDIVTSLWFPRLIIHFQSF